MRVISTLNYASTLPWPQTKLTRILQFLAIHSHYMHRIYKYIQRGPPLREYTKCGMMCTNNNRWVIFECTVVCFIEPCSLSFSPQLSPCFQPLISSYYYQREKPFFLVVADLRLGRFSFLIVR